MNDLKITPATEADIPVVLEMIQGLAEYEMLAHLVVATEEKLRQTLFGPRPSAEVLLAWTNTRCAGIALFFSSYSTFLAQPGIYLEDLYVKPELRGQGHRNRFTCVPRRAGPGAWLRPSGMGGT